MGKGCKCVGGRQRLSLCGWQSWFSVSLFHLCFLGWHRDGTAGRYLGAVAFNCCSTPVRRSQLSPFAMWRKSDWSKQGFILMKARGGAASTKDKQGFFKPYLWRNPCRELRESQEDSRKGACLWVCPSALGSGPHPRCCSSTLFPEHACTVPVSCAGRLGSNDESKTLSRVPTSLQTGF